FQAEDGIRDRNVTGVQTCALPIFTNEQKKYHPITGERIIGFQIPFWERTLEMVKKAAGLYSGNRSIGWDIVITKSGPGLIEGNHDWCKLLWQLPVEKGLKGMLID